MAELDSNAILTIGRWCKDQWGSPFACVAAMALGASLMWSRLPKAAMSPLFKLTVVAIVAIAICIVWWRTNLFPPRAKGKELSIALGAVYAPEKGRTKFHPTLISRVESTLTRTFKGGNRFGVVDLSSAQSKKLQAKSVSFLDFETESNIPKKEFRGHDVVLSLRCDHTSVNGQFGYDVLPTAHIPLIHNAEVDGRELHRELREFWAEASRIEESNSQATLNEISEKVSIGALFFSAWAMALKGASLPASSLLESMRVPEIQGPGNKALVKQLAPKTRVLLMECYATVCESIYHELLDLVSPEKAQLLLHFTGKAKELENGDFPSIFFAVSESIAWVILGKPNHALGITKSIIQVAGDGFWNLNLAFLLTSTGKPSRGFEEYKRCKRLEIPANIVQRSEQFIQSQFDLDQRPEYSLALGAIADFLKGDSLSAMEAYNDFLERAIFRKPNYRRVKGQVQNCLQRVKNELTN